MQEANLFGCLTHNCLVFSETVIKVCISSSSIIASMERKYGWGRKLRNGSQEEIIFLFLNLGVGEQWI